MTLPHHIDPALTVAGRRLRRWLADRRAQHELRRYARLDRRFLKDIGLTEADLTRRPPAALDIATRVAADRATANGFGQRIESCAM